MDKKPRYASMSMFLSARDQYECQHPWPEMKLQCGDRGTVFTDPTRSRKTAFFEAFPTVPDTFIRGEGATIQQAEDAAWAKWQQIIMCDHPGEFEKRGYTNGVGFCPQCGMFKPDAFPPSETCVRCGANTYWTCDINNNWWCQACAPQMPQELMSNVG